MGIGGARTCPHGRRKRLQCLITLSISVMSGRTIEESGQPAHNHGANIPPPPPLPRTASQALDISPRKSVGRGSPSSPSSESEGRVIPKDSLKRVGSKLGLSKLDATKQPSRPPSRRNVSHEANAGNNPTSTDPQSRDLTRDRRTSRDAGRAGKTSRRRLVGEVHTDKI